jgi:hypothetical protein
VTSPERFVGDYGKNHQQDYRCHRECGVARADHRLGDLLEAQPKPMGYRRPIQPGPQHACELPRRLGARLTPAAFTEVFRESVGLAGRELSVQIGVEQESSLDAVHLAKGGTPSAAGKFLGDPGDDPKRV